MSQYAEGIGHFRVVLCLIKTSPRASYSNENEFDTKTRTDTEEKCNSEMDYSFNVKCAYKDNCITCILFHQLQKEPPLGTFAVLLLPKVSKVG